MSSQKLLERTRRILRRKHYAYRTEQRYLAWIRRFILFHSKRHPVHMGRAEIETFLTHLAVKEKVAAATQNQALNALLFLYRHVLNVPIDFPLSSVRARRRKHVPTVLSKEEAQRLLPSIEPPYQLMARLLYGSGLRVSECVRLRVKDVDFEQRHLAVRDGKGAKDRITLLPEAVIEEMKSGEGFCPSRLFSSNANPIHQLDHPAPTSMIRSGLKCRTIAYSNALSAQFNPPLTAFLSR